MTGSRVEVGLCVIFGSLVFILDEQTNGGPKGNSMFNSRLYLYQVLFISLIRGVTS
jgi:hypothetical protein